jgi:hypothetical protein
MNQNICHLWVAISLSALGGCVAVATITENPDNSQPVQPASWAYETVTELSAELNGLDVVLDDADQLHISLVDGNHLDYLTHDEVHWVRDPVDRAGGREGNPSAIRVDESGRVHHAYWKGGYVMYAQGEEMDWNVESLHKVSSATSPFVSLSLSASAHMAVRYSGQVWHLSEEDAWAFSGVALGYAQWNAMEFDKDGIGHLITVDHLISQADTEAQQLHGTFAIRHGRYDDGEWEIQAPIESHEGWLGYPDLDWRGRLPSTAVDLVLDGSGRLHLAYFFAVDPDDPATPWVLRYAVQTAQGWAIETIDAQASVGYHVSLALGPDGTPHVSYFHDGEQQVYYGTRQEGSWLTQAIEPGVASGPRSGIVVSSGSLVSVVYPSDGQLRRGILEPAPE